MPVVSRLAALRQPIRLFATASVIAIALMGCQTKPLEQVVVTPSLQIATTAGHPLTENSPSFYNMPNIPADHTPVRIGVILPFNSGTPAVKALAASMLKAAQLAVYESGNKDIVLMTADEGATPSDAANAAERLLNQGAEIIVGRFYGPPARAIAPQARDRGVLVLSFSTDRSVAGDGTYLRGFLPQNDTSRVVTYALAQGHHKIAALVPRTSFGDVTLDTLKAN